MCYIKYGFNLLLKHWHELVAISAAPESSQFQIVPSGNGRESRGPFTRKLTDLALQWHISLLSSCGGSSSLTAHWLNCAAFGVPGRVNIEGRDLKANARVFPDSIGRLECYAAHAIPTCSSQQKQLIKVFSGHN
jgi:hypothetical protein